MKLPLAILGLALVLVPTAILSFMASRTLRDWDVIVQHRLQQGGHQALQSIRARVDDRVQGELDAVRDALAQSMARGGTLGDVSSTARRLMQIQEPLWVVAPAGSMPR